MTTAWKEMADGAVTAAIRALNIGVYEGGCVHLPDEGFLCGRCELEIMERESLVLARRCYEAGYRAGQERMRIAAIAYTERVTKNGVFNETITAAIRATGDGIAKLPLEPPPGGEE